MLYQKDSNKIPKKTAEKLSKFSYYVDTLFPEVSQQTKNKLSDFSQKKTHPHFMNMLHSKTTSRNMTYNYFYSKCDNLAAINSSSILSSVKKLYLNQDVIKINQMSYGRESVFVNKSGYLTGNGWWKEIIDFVLIQGKQTAQEKTLNVDQHNINDSKQRSKYITTSTASQSLSKTTPINKKPITNQNLTRKRQYWLYVIHNNCNSTQSHIQQTTLPNRISWENFIQRYHFVTVLNSTPNGKGNNSAVKSTQLSLSTAQTNDENTITYQLLFSYKPSPGQQSYFSFQQTLTKSFIQSQCKLTKQNNLHCLQKLQGYLLQRSSQVQSTIARQKDIAFSDQHRRQTKIPVQYFKHYLKLKQQIYQYYLQLHSLSSQDEINKYFYQNLVCRYLLAKEYHFDEAKKAIVEYLNWEKQMKEKYPSIESFKEYHQLGAYQCIGEDFMGRPVLLSKSALIDVNKLPDIEKYCDYYIYFLEIHLRQKMRGYVDQMLVIGDLTDLGARNFKLAVTKRNVGDSLKYGPQRQHALIIVHASTFAYTAWTFIKPLLPKKTLHKIEISGHNKKQIVEALSSRMDIKVIPQYLGGLNQNVDKQFLKNDESPNNKNNQQQEMQFIKSKKTNSAMVKMQRVGTQENEDNFQKVVMVTIQSSITQKKSQENVLFSFFQSITKTFGFNFGV